MRSFRRGVAPLLVGVLLVACANDPTQLVVVVDTDLPLGTSVDSITVRVTGPSGMAESERATLGAGDRGRLPLTLGISPTGEEMGPIEIDATASLGGRPVLVRSHRVTLVRGTTRMLEIHLAASCVGRATPCAAGQTCSERGCTSIEVDPSSLSDWSGTATPLGDGGTPPMDARVDATTDAAPIDAAPDACSHDSDCDDGNPCTTDRCETTHCSNQNSTAPCDDGVFCNGRDTCSEGSCGVHTGSPCGGSTVCDEGAGQCTGCVTDDECPAATRTDGECTFSAGDVCDTRGTRNVTEVSFVCESGACQATTNTSTGSCSRVTDGVVCSEPACDAWSTCTGGTTCATSGTRTRTCSDRSSCDAGLCQPARTRIESEPCTRVTEGVVCGLSSCLDSLCTGIGCSTSGTLTRSCSNPICRSGSCDMRSTTTTHACTRVTDGNACDDRMSCTRNDSCFRGFCQGLDSCGRDCACTSSGCESTTIPARLCLIEVIE